jgi:hypothetical protein
MRENDELGDLESRQRFLEKFEDQTIENLTAWDIISVQPSHNFHDQRFGPLRLAFKQMGDPKLAATDDKVQSWHNRIQMAPGALCLLALSSLSGSKLIEIDLAASLTSIIALLVGAGLGAIIPFHRLHRAKADKGTAILATEAHDGGSEGGYIRQELGTLMGRLRTLQSKFKNAVQRNSPLPDPKNGFDGWSSWTAAKAEIDALNNAISEYRQQHTLFQARMNELPSSYAKLLKKERLFKIFTKFCFWISIGLFFVGALNPIVVLALGPFFEWSPVGLEHVKALAK